MLVLGERIIAYLRTIASITTLLGGEYIFSTSVAEDEPVRIEVETSVGLDEGATPTDEDTIIITAIVSRTVENAHLVCLNLAKLIDASINRSEDDLTDTTYTVLNITRKSSSGLRIDDETGEFWYALTYDYIMENDEL